MRFKKIFIFLLKQTGLLLNEDKYVFIVFIETYPSFCYSSTYYLRNSTIPFGIKKQPKWAQLFNNDVEKN